MAANDSRYISLKGIFLNIIFDSNKASLAVILLFLFCVSFPAASKDAFKTPPLTRESARALFQSAVDKQQKTEAALEIFQQDTLLPGAIRLLYLGALQTLKARDASFPFTKMKWLKRGLSAIEEARRMDPLNIEIIFMQGVVWQKIPGILGYRDNARKNFGILLDLLPNQWEGYHPQFIREIFSPFTRRSRLDPGAIRKVKYHRKSIRH